MNRHRSRLPLVLVLALAVGLVVFLQWRNRSAEASSQGDGFPSSEKSGTVPDGFGPIPLAATPNQIPAEQPRRDARGVSGEMKLLAARMSRETADLEVVTHADGRRSVSLEGGFHHMSAVVTGADGKQEVRCFTDFQEMAAALPGGRPVDPSRPATHAR
jgi:hypothetical protein